MIKFVLKADFGCQILEWDKNVVSIKDPDNFTGQTKLTKRNMGEVFIRTKEPDFTRQATERVVKVLAITYAKTAIDKVATAAVQLDKYQNKKLSSLPT